MRIHISILTFITTATLSAQTPTTPPQLSPQAAYNQAIAPVEITHRSIANWSDIELNSLGVAVAQAKDACLSRTSQTYTGDDLIAFARLCDLGLQWPIVYTAATTYINSKDPSKPQLAQAYAYEVKADLNLRDEKGALNTSIAMLLSVPYSAITDEVTTSTILYLQFAFTSDALTLHSRRQPILLNLLRAAQTGTTPPIPLHTLFEHALDFAALEQYDNQLRLAAIILADIDKAMPASPPSDEALLITADRHQYALIGTPYPRIHGAISLDSATPTPRFGNVTVLFLFPPWCAQCIRQAHEIAPAVTRLKESDVPIFALLADIPAPPASKPTSKRAPTIPHHSPHQAAAQPSAPEPPPSAHDQLLGTPTLVVSPSVLTDFNAIDFPFIIVLDHNDIIRLLQPVASETTLVPGGSVDQIATHILTQWPPPGSLPTAR